MSKKWGVEKSGKIQGVKLESYHFAYKIFIFHSIVENSKLPKADLSYESPHMFIFPLCLIRTAQYCSENEQPKKRTVWKFANKMLIFASIFKYPELVKAELSYESPHMSIFSYIPYGLHNTALKINNRKAFFFHIGKSKGGKLQKR